MRFKAVLFDLDGTLLDTLDDLAESTNQVLEQADFPTHSRDEYRYFVGDGVETLIRRALPEPFRDDPLVVKDLVWKQRAVYGSRWDLKTRPYDGISELLGGLAERRIPAAVLSNKPDDTTAEVVKRYFDRLIGLARGQRPEVPKKPDPAGALAIARQWGLDPAGILYLGDTSVDMKTAIGAGMYPVGALWGFRTREELVESGAKELAERPQDVLAILDRS